MSVAFFSRLADAGLNLHAVFEVAALPATVRSALGSPDSPESHLRLLLVGHGGRALWRRVEAMRASLPTDHPIDAYSTQVIQDGLLACYPEAHATFVYPQPLDVPLAVDLQLLGALAGWHHPAPFRVGINATWGAWFACRALVLTDAPLVPTPRVESVAPCVSCSGRPCLVACPAGALDADAERFGLARCLAYRLAPESRCALTCRARLACPVAPEHRYEDAQLAHSYGESLRMLKAWREAP